MTHYYYNTDNYQVKKITTIQSNGDENYQEIKYTSDFNSSGILGTLYQNNLVSLPVASTSSFKKSGSTTILYLNEKVTEFIQLTNGDIKPSRIIEQRFNQPQTSVILYSGPANTPYLPYKETQTFNYDAATGNLIGIKDEGNHVVSNIYDYEDKYIAASVINAEPITDKPAYTSFETPSFGGWTLIGTASQVIGTAITGSRYFTLSSGKSFNANLNTAKPYRLTFWASGPLTVTSGATLLKSGPAINGYTYYEYKIAQGTNAVTVSGTASIDELRLYPETARMRTVTYDPLIGKTSECDENNRITYYEYDELGRQKFIKDENRNIVKMYEYNTVSNKQSGCPGTYYNRLISEIFTKNNCSSGYIGGNVTYIIPANKYSSAISQADADQKAENELITDGQNKANTEGTCIQTWKNQAMSQNFTTEGCTPGFVGGTVPYSVSANKYTSAISLANANQMAQDEIDANGQAYANSVAHRICNASTAPDWQGYDPAVTKCEVTSNGTYTQHQLLKQVDKNPGSQTYNETRWADMGLNTAGCPLPTMINVKYTNTSSYAAYIELTNISTEHTYIFYLPTGQPANTIVGQIPLGSYDAYLYSTGPGNFNYRIYTFMQFGVPSMTVSNVSPCATCANITVTNP